MTNIKVWTKNFTLLLIANVISRIGTVIYNVVLAWWITEQTGSAKIIGVILAATLVPTALFSLVGGEFSDRLNKKNILIVTDILSGLMSILTAIMAYYKIVNVPILIMTNFILGTSSCLFKPTFKSIVPEIIEKNSLVKANTFLTSAAETTKVIGPFIGAFILSISLLGAPGAFLINGLSFILSAILELFIDYKKSNVNTKKQGNVMENIKEGLVYVYKNKIIINILILVSVINVFLASFEVLMPLFVQNILMEGSKYYSYILSAYSLGGICVILTSFFVTKLPINQKTLAISIALSGIPLLFLTLLAKSFTLFIIIFIFGFTGSIFNTLFFSYIQINVEKQFLGRTFSTMYLIAFIATPIAYVVFGYLGNTILNTVFIYVGISVILCALPLIISKDKKKEKEEKETEAAI